MSERGLAAGTPLPEEAPEDFVTLSTPRELYRRWERQHWTVADIGVERDRAPWASLGRFLREAVTEALAELEVGEVTVTRLLTALIDFAPEPDDQLYLCTQLADEARHVRFLETYMGANAIGEAAPERTATSFGEHFASRLRAQTEAVRVEGAPAGQWYRVLAWYHLVAEGMLAVTVTRSVRRLARRAGLVALEEGLASVARDESRHVVFGLLSARRGVRDGHRQAIAAAYLEAVEQAARVLVGPGRARPLPVFPQALRVQSRDMEIQWEVAGDRAIRQLDLIGLGGLAGDVRRTWSDTCSAALDEYRERWGRDHPVRRAQTLTAFGC